MSASDTQPSDRDNRIRFNQLVRLARHFERCHRYEQAAYHYRDAETLFKQDKLSKKISKCNSMHVEMQSKRESSFQPISPSSPFLKNLSNG
jgi:hypothetical protein